MLSGTLFIIIILVVASNFIITTYLPLPILQTQLKGSPAQLFYRINHDVLDTFLDAVKKGSFTSIRPKNKNPRKHSHICELVDGQQSQAVSSPSTNLSAHGQQSQLLTVNNLNCSPSTNSTYIELENITKTTTESEEPVHFLSHLSHSDEIPSPSSLTQQDQLDQLAPYSQLRKPDQPTSQIHSLLPKQSESLHQNSDPAFGSNGAGSFDNLEQMNLIPASTPEFIFPEATKAQHYQMLDAQGVKLTRTELQQWAAFEIGQYVKTYRKSGFILTGGNDVSGEFAVYVSKQNCKKGQQPTIALGFNVINKCENDPRCWQKLVVWVTEWQQLRQTGQQVNVASTVNEQQELDRIRQAASTKFEL